MNKIFEILLIMLTLSIVIQQASAMTETVTLKEGQDYTCIDNVYTKSPPSMLPNVVIDKSIERLI